MVRAFFVAVIKRSNQAVSKREMFMYECEKFDYCHFPLQVMPAMPHTSKLVQHLYCKSNYEKCARYLVGKTLGPTAVPDNLSPSDSQLANLLLS
jgi:hypothetical protein